MLIQSFHRCSIEEGNIVTKIDLNSNYDKVENIYNEILKDKVFNDNFDTFLNKFKEFVVDIGFYNVCLIEYDIYVNLNEFIDQNIIEFIEE